jgi:hypothetical protein
MAHTLPVTVHLAQPASNWTLVTLLLYLFRETLLLLSPPSSLALIQQAVGPTSYNLVMLCQLFVMLGQLCAPWIPPMLVTSVPLCKLITATHMGSSPTWRQQKHLPMQLPCSVSNRRPSLPVLIPLVCSVVLSVVQPTGSGSCLVIWFGTRCCPTSPSCCVTAQTKSTCCLLDTMIIHRKAIMPAMEVAPAVTRQLVNGETIWTAVNLTSAANPVLCSLFQP